MRQFKLLGVMFLAVCSLGAVVAASVSAMATPGILPIGLFTDKSPLPSKFIGTGLFGEATIECAKDESTGGFRTSLLGTFDVLFLACLVNAPIVGLLLCTGLRDSVESSILVLGTFHLRYREVAKRRVVLAFLIQPVHFVCKNTGGTEILVEVRGCAAGEIGPINTPVRLPNPFIMTMKRRGVENEITKVLNELGTTEETCLLESKEGMREFSQGGEETTDEIFPNSTSAEIMA